MGKVKNKKNVKAKANSNDKVQILKNLPTCTVVLHNIALDKDLIELYQLRFSEKKKEKLKHSSSCMSKNSFNNVQMLKENIQKDSTGDETSRITRSRTRKLSEENKAYKNVTRSNNVSYNQYPKIIQRRSITQRRKLKSDTSFSITSFTTTSYDETSTISSTTYYSPTQEKIVRNNKRNSNNRLRRQKRYGCKRKLYFDQSGTSLESIKMSSDSENYLDEKNLASTDYNSKMPRTSNEIPVKFSLIPQMKLTKYFTKNCNNLYTADTNRIICKRKLKECDKNQSIKVPILNAINTNADNSETSEDIKTNFKSKNPNSSDNTINNTNGSQNQEDTRMKSSDTSLTENIKQTNISESSVLKSTCPMVSKTTRLDNYVPVCKILPDFHKTYNEKQHENETNNKINKNLPKITGDHILPKGTVKMIKINNESLENNSSEQVYVEENGYNCTNSNAKQVPCIDTLESTNIFKEKECCTSEINRSIDMLKTSESIVLNNNVILRNKNIDNKLHSTKIDHNLSFDTESKTAYKYCISNHQENELDKSTMMTNDEEHNNNILQNDEKYNETNSITSILNNNISNLTNVNESCNVNGSLIGKEEIIKQNRKRIAEENTADVKLNKKRKLNRNMWQNITCTKSLDYKQFNDPSNTDTKITIKSSLDEENNSKEQIDLRKHLNKIKTSKQSSKLSIPENKFNNKNSVESEQINLNSVNDIISSTNTKNKEFYKLSFDKELASSQTSYKEKDTQTKDTQTDSVYNNHNNTLQSISKEIQHINPINRNTPAGTKIQEKYTIGDYDNDDDDDCISLFAESFDTNFYENTSLSEKQKPNKIKQEENKSLLSDVPYEMTINSFNKYVKQNATEFNKEYAKYEENSIEISKIDETKRKFNDQSQSQQITRTKYIPEIKTASQVIQFEVKNVNYESLKKNYKNIFNGYCFSILRKGSCYKPLQCQYKHNFLDLINAVYSEDSSEILHIMQDALYLGNNYFCKTLYVKLLQKLQKLTTDQILIMYEMFYDIRILKDELFSKNYITQTIIKELLNRQISLKEIVDCLIKYIPENSHNPNNLINLLTCVENYKPSEYWNTVRTLVLKLLPNINMNIYISKSKFIIQKILAECIKNENLTDVQDVNDNLINKIPPSIMSILDKDIIERFKSLLAEKTTHNSSMILDKNFGENLSETIASPDGDTNLLQTESPKCSSTFINKSANESKNYKSKVNEEMYKLQSIDDLPVAQSVYRDHKHLWKFYVDLDRFKKGLIHHDYDYVINVLKNYTEMQNENSLFVRSCCNILRTEVKRSEYHLANIIRQTVQMGTFNILGKVLFHIGLDILTSLVDKEAWGLALWLIQSLDIYNLSYNAEYLLLSAEIYLANKKAIKAYDLLKNQNIICTNRDKWYAKSTINDERVRNKIMYILLDSFCNEFIEHAFFLFQFLLKDQSSQYYPIDLSRYVDKLIILSLSKKDTTLIIDVANLVLKYTFALSTTICRALISTLIHLDENLTKQIYNYAEGIGIYPTMKLWPVTYITLNNDLTEEEIYLIFMQLLKNFIMNVGHAIEFVKPQQIKVYLILEIKSTKEQFYHAELQNYYNNKAILNMKILIRKVLKKRFDPPIILMSGKGRIYKLQSKSLINYLKAEHCN